MPLALEKDPASTEIVAVPEKPERGVNVAVYVVPEPANALRFPPVRSISANTKSVLDCPRVKVSAAVDAPPSVSAELVMVTDGLLLSMV